MISSTWIAGWFFVLILAIIVGAYAVQARRPTVREWRYIVVTIVFLMWMLPCLAALRSH
jgi:hypothetical protein